MFELLESVRNRHRSGRRLCPSWRARRRGSQRYFM